MALRALNITSFILGSILFFHEKPLPISASNSLADFTSSSDPPVYSELVF